MVKVRIGALLAAVALGGCASPSHSAAQTQSASEAAAATITEADYLRRVHVIAHDSRGGRNTPSPGLDKTAAWIASEFQRFGLRGGAPEGGFIQRYPLRSLVVDREASGLTGGPRRLAYGTDLAPVFGAAGAGESTGGTLLLSGARDVTGALVDNAVRGQHVIVFPATTRGLDQEIVRLAISLRGSGAASVLVALDVGDADWAAFAGRALQPEVAQGWDAQPGAGGAFRPILAVRTRAVEELLRGRSIDVAALQRRGDEAARVDRVPGLVLTLTQRTRDERITAPNVVGVLEGSDPALRNEHVVFSAHMDHVGYGTPNAEGDSIFNGADDDASGTVAVVEMAEAFASLPTRPRRSLIFLLVSGEEKGLWGSEHYANNPTVPAAQLVADLNVDMVGRNWTDTIVAIGKEHSDLGSTLERVNRAHPELGMTAIDDIWPQESFYTRSDHFNFAVKGVPILFFFNGTHADYHGLDDEPERIDGEKAARIARLVFYLGLEIANADARPAWNPDSYRSIVGRSR